MKISIIVAIGKNREIGKDNKLLWHIPEDLERFKRITLGHPIIMGRRTFESIGRILPNRTNIIVTRDENYQKEGSIVCHSLEEAIEIAKKSPGSEEIFIIGGGQIFEQAIKLADKLYLTLIEQSFEADTYFPDYSVFKKVIKKEKGQASGYRYTYLELEKSSS